MADVVARDLRVPARSGQLTLHKFARRKSTIAFLMALPLLTIVLCLVVYPAFYSIHLATLNKSMQHFVGFGNFEFLFRRNTFWMVVEQSIMFAVTAVIFKAVVGFIVAHFVHNLPAKGQRKWRGMLLIPWVIPPAIPVAIPGIIAAMIFTFTVSWANFLYPLAFTTSADQLVLPVGIVTTLIRGDVYAWGQIMTGALLGAAPPLIIYAFLMDYYISGLTAGATKG